MDEEVEDGTVDLPDAEALQAAFAEAMPETAADPQRRRQRRVAKAKRKKVSNARSALLVVVALLGLACLFYAGYGLVVGQSILLLEAAVYLILTAVYVGLYAWARRQPFPALLAGLVLFVGLWLLDVIAALFLDPSGVFSGIIGRIVITFFLVRGLLAAKPPQPASA